MEEQEWNELWNAAIDVQYLIMRAGGMASKSIVEDYLMERFGLDHYTVRRATNFVMDKFYFMSDGWHEWNAHRPAPRLSDHPGLAEWLDAKGRAYPLCDRMNLGGL